MKKTYLIPAMQVELALTISDTTVDGSNALTKEDTSWDIWNEE